MADKDVEGLLGAFEPVMATIVCTQNSTPRSMRAEVLADIARGIFGDDRVEVATRLDDAIEKAVNLAESGQVDDIGWGGGGVLVTGSVITAGEARMLLGGELMRDPRRMMCATILALQCIVLGLSTPVLITVEDVDKAHCAVDRARAGAGGAAAGRAAALRVGVLRRLRAAGGDPRARVRHPGDVRPRPPLRRPLDDGVPARQEDRGRPGAWGADDPPSRLTPAATRRRR